MDSDKKLGGLSAAQREALLDLLVLAMYADGNLDLIEDGRVQRLLGALGYKTKYDRNRVLDETVTRVRPYAENPGLARGRAADLARHFTRPEEKQLIVGVVENIILSDGNASPEEVRFLETVKASFAADRRETV